MYFNFLNGILCKLLLIVAASLPGVFSDALNKTLLYIIKLCNYNNCIDSIPFFIKYIEIILGMCFNSFIQNNSNGSLIEIIFMKKTKIHRLV